MALLEKDLLSPFPVILMFFLQDLREVVAARLKSRHPEPSGEKLLSKRSSPEIPYTVITVLQP
jgi:hypothetical protein